MTNRELEVLTFLLVGLVLLLAAGCAFIVPRTGPVGLVCRPPVTFDEAGVNCRRPEPDGFSVPWPNVRLFVIVGTGS